MRSTLPEFLDVGSQQLTQLAELRQMLEILFRREGLEVVSTPGVKLALAAIAQSPEPFPVVLTDLAMPDGTASSCSPPG